ncbi:MAG: type VI secretion system protein ImpF [Planctomycetaceae bacterium]|jgi:type VI secretion system protein ImpF
MSQVPSRQPLVPSILDRLIDDEPGHQREDTKQRYQIIRELKESLQRDLEQLLNTRWRCKQWPPEHSELDVSLVNYGIPDFTGVHFTSAERQQELRDVIETVIHNYEPRLSEVSVEFSTGREHEDRTCQFRIDALLMVDPAPEPVSFDTTLEPVTGDFSVQGGAG